MGGYDDDEAEAAAVVRWLRLARGPGRSWSGLAVVARTNARLDPVARALARSGIPVRRGRPETPGTLPGRGAPGTALWHLRRAPRQDSLRSVLAELVTSPQDAVAGGAHLAELAPTLARLADEQALDLPGATVGEFLDWLAGTGGTTDLDTPALDAVELSTFHRAKGLEWPAVAVVGLEDGMVPIAYATGADALAEERRLLYVALTRAQDELWCSWARRRSAGDRSWTCEASPLLAAVEAAACAEEPDTSPAALAARFASLRAGCPPPAERGASVCDPASRRGWAAAATGCGSPGHVHQHGGVVRGLLSLAGVAVHERVLDPVGQRTGRRAPGRCEPRAGGKLPAR